MSFSSAGLMVILDGLIVAALAYALWTFHRHKKAVLVKELRGDFFLIAAGLGVIGVAYLGELVFRNLIGIFVDTSSLTQIYEFLRHTILWPFVPVGTILITLGFAKSILRASGLIAKLREQEFEVDKIGREADSARNKLDQRECQMTEQNARFQTALENMSQGLCMFDSEQRLIISNDLYASMYGLSKDIVKPGTTFRQILEYRIKNNVFVGDDPEKYLEERLAAVAEGEASTKIQRLADGRVLAISHRPLPDGGWVATHEDITELAKAEAMNQRLASIVEKAINEVYVFDPVMLKFQLVNASACNNLGYSKEELLQMTPLDIKPEFDHESFEELVSSLRVKKSEYIEFETVHRRKDGSTYDARLTLQLITSQNEQVFTAIAEDVTERKLVEREFKQSQELFSKAFHVNPVPFSISGPDGRIFDLNEAWLSTLGYTREEAIGNSALKLGIWADPKERERFVELLKKNGSVTGFETKYRTKDGELRDMLVSGEWVEVRGDERMFNISHDVTERKATERQLLEDRDMLQALVNEATADLKAKAQELEIALAREKELNELQRQFVSMASHEFRTPLAIIDSTAQRLKKKLENGAPQEAAKRVDKIRRAVERMTRLMESTLTAARLEDGKIAVALEECDVGAIVSEVCTRQQELTTQHTITCELDGLPKTIKADAGALDQMLTNLLSNAVKYSPDSPDIRVRAHNEGDDIVLQVQDQGLGIDAEDLPNMFSRFYRAKTSSGIAGTGIGLNLVKTLAEMHGGSVGVESVKNEGSTFTVRLPVNGPAQDVQAA